MRQRVTPRAARRGTAMIESVLVLGVLLPVIVMIVFFGRGLMRAQRAAMVDRYETWRSVADAPGPGASSPYGESQLNQTFFGDNASSVERHVNDLLRSTAPGSLVTYTGQNYAAESADLMAGFYGSWPRGRTVRMVAHHRETIRMFTRFPGPIVHRHTRLGHDWRFANGLRRTSEGWVPSGPRTSARGQLRSTFYDVMDEDLAALAADNPLAGAVRSHYLADPGYRGPTVQ